MAAAHTQRCTVVGVFEDHRKADQAVADLMRAGFRKDQIGVAMRHTDQTGTAVTSDDTGEGSHAGTGALTGALTGLGLGALAGLGVLAGVVPVVGPAIAAGTLGVVLSNAAAGVGIGGLIGALIGAGIPEEEAEYYHKEFEAGRTIVTVQADENANEAREVLRRNGAYDVTDRSSSSTRATTGHTEGTYSAGTTTRPMDTGVVLNEACSTGTTHGTMAGSTHGTAHATGHGSETIQAKEERLRAEKHPIEKGEVNVRKEVHTETQTLEVPVKREEVVIERTPGHGQPTSFNAADMRAGEEVRIPVREEQVNVKKDAVVAEEVKVGKHVVQDTEKVAGQVRKDEIKVDKTGDVDVKKR
jgi:uncharacterized protein (TIGR02271 family)